MTKPVPEWLQHRLTDMGRWNTDGVSRIAKLRTCRRCGGRVVTGLDDDRCAIPVSTDPTQLDPTAEYLALSLGRTTYSLRPGGPYLDRRDPWTIANPTRPYPVLPNHQCRPGQTPLRIDDAILNIFGLTTKETVSDDIPF